MDTLEDSVSSKAVQADFQNALERKKRKLPTKGPRIQESQVEDSFTKNGKNFATRSIQVDLDIENDERDQESKKSKTSSSGSKLNSPDIDDFCRKKFKPIAPKPVLGKDQHQPVVMATVPVKLVTTSGATTQNSASVTNVMNSDCKTLVLNSGLPMFTNASFILQPGGQMDGCLSKVFTLNPATSMPSESGIQVMMPVSAANSNVTAMTSPNSMLNGTLQGTPIDNNNEMDKVASCPDPKTLLNGMAIPQRLGNVPTSQGSTSGTGNASSTAGKVPVNANLPPNIKDILRLRPSKYKYSLLLNSPAYTNFKNAMGIPTVVAGPDGNIISEHFGVGKNIAICGNAAVNMQPVTVATSGFSSSSSMPLISPIMIGTVQPTNQVQVAVLPGGQTVLKPLVSPTQVSPVLPSHGVQILTAVPAAMPTTNFPVLQSTSGNTMPSSTSNTSTTAVSSNTGLFTSQFTSYATLPAKQTHSNTTYTVPAASSRYLQTVSYGNSRQQNPPNSLSEYNPVMTRSNNVMQETMSNDTNQMVSSHSTVHHNRSMTCPMNSQHATSRPSTGVSSSVQDSIPSTSTRSDFNSLIQPTTKENPTASLSQFTSVQSTTAVSTAPIVTMYKPRNTNTMVGSLGTNIPHQGQTTGTPISLQEPFQRPTTMFVPHIPLRSTEMGTRPPLPVASSVSFPSNFPVLSSMSSVQKNSDSLNLHFQPSDSGNAMSANLSRPQANPAANNVSGRLPVTCLAGPINANTSGVNSYSSFPPRMPSILSNPVTSRPVAVPTTSYGSLARTTANSSVTGTTATLPYHVSSQAVNGFPTHSSVAAPHTGSAYQRMPVSAPLNSTAKTVPSHPHRVPNVTDHSLRNANISGNQPRQMLPPPRTAPASLPSMNVSSYSQLNLAASALQGNGVRLPGPSEAIRPPFQMPPQVHQPSLELARHQSAPPRPQISPNIESGTRNFPPYVHGTYHPPSSLANPPSTLSIPVRGTLSWPAHVTMSSSQNSLPAATTDTVQHSSFPVASSNSTSAYSGQPNGSHFLLQSENLRATSIPATASSSALSPIFTSPSLTSVSSASRSYPPPRFPRPEGTYTTQQPTFSSGTATRFTHNDPRSDSFRRAPPNALSFMNSYSQPHMNSTRLPSQSSDNTIPNMTNPQMPRLGVPLQHPVTTASYPASATGGAISQQNSIPASNTTSQTVPRTSASVSSMSNLLSAVAQSRDIAQMGRGQPNQVNQPSPSAINQMSNVPAPIREQTVRARQAPPRPSPVQESNHTQPEVESNSSETFQEIPAASSTSKDKQAEKSGKREPRSRRSKPKTAKANKASAVPKTGSAQKARNTSQAKTGGTEEQPPQQQQATSRNSNSANKPDQPPATKVTVHHKPNQSMPNDVSVSQASSASSESLQRVNVPYMHPIYCNTSTPTIANVSLDNLHRVPMHGHPIQGHMHTLPPPHPTAPPPSGTSGVTHTPQPAPPPHPPSHQGPGHVYVAPHYGHMHRHMYMPPSPRPTEFSLLSPRTYTPVHFQQDAALFNPSFNATLPSPPSVSESILTMHPNPNMVENRMSSTLLYESPTFHHPPPPPPPPPHPPPPQTLNGIAEFHPNHRNLPSRFGQHHPFRGGLPVPASAPTPAAAMAECVSNQIRREQSTNSRETFRPPPRETQGVQQRNVPASYSSVSTSESSPALSRSVTVSTSPTSTAMAPLTQQIMFHDKYLPLELSVCTVSSTSTENTPTNVQSNKTSQPDDPIKFGDIVLHCSRQILRESGRTVLCCWNCDYHTAEPKKMHRHQRSEDRPMKCQLCSFKGNSRCQVNQHFKVAHMQPDNDPLRDSF